MCAKFVECRVDPGGRPFTAESCRQFHSQATADCVAKDATSIALASDGTIDACVQALQQWPCESVCVQSPQQPVACQQLDPNSTSDPVPCAP